MSKYFETIKIMFKSQMTYRFDIITNIILSITKIILAYILWSAIFEKQNIISGFTFNTMLTYYIISTFISQLDNSSTISWLISSEIKNGSFSKYIVRPFRIFGYFSARVLGITAFLVMFNLIATIMWFIFFDISFVIKSSFTNIMLVFALVILGIIFMMQLNYFIGILAFKFLDTSLFIMIKDNIMQFITGSLIPLNLLPTEILAVMKYLPFYYISYLPSMVLLGRNEKELLLGFIIILLWNIGFIGVNRLTYKGLKSEYDGVGI